MSEQLIKVGDNQWEQLLRKEELWMQMKEQNVKVQVLMVENIKPNLDSKEDKVEIDEVVFEVKM